MLIEGRQHIISFDVKGLSQQTNHPVKLCFLMPLVQIRHY